MTRKSYKLNAPEPQGTSELLENLNPVQAEAASLVDGPLLILAGAGSGKTRVMTHRIAYLIRECGVWPEQILAMTFTNKACAEMRERVDEILGDDGLDEARRVTISTFHSLGARLLRIYARDLGLSSDFVIYDDVDQMALIKRLMEDDDRDKDRSEARRLRGFIERMKNRGLTPEQAHEEVYDSNTENDVHFYELYQSALREANCVDFGDLLLGLLQVLRNDPKTAKSLSNQYRYVMVDEFQDTNPAQYELLKHLTREHNNLAVVGDDDQAIYRWRGATVANILGFEKDFPNARVVKLEQNYRSTQTILDAANDVIELNTQRRPKKLWTDNVGGEKIRCFTASDDREEAAYVAREITAYSAESVPFGEMAVFYRTNAQGRAFEEQLRFAQIPYRVVGGTSFYAREEIKDVLAYLKVALNPRNEVDLLRVLNKPTRGVGKTSIDRLRIAGASTSIWSAIEAVAHGGQQQSLEFLEAAKLRGKSKTGVVDFYEVVREVQAMLDEGQELAVVVSELLDRIHYLDWLQSHDAERAEDRTRNVGELVNAIMEFERESDLEGLDVLRAFLDRSSLVQATDDLGSGAVTLMTVHGSKGLEFDVVFLAGMEDEIFPSVRTEDPEELDEERRLAYVAITRARKELVITNAKRRRIFGQYRPTTPSRFVLDIDPERLHVDSASTSSHVDYVRGAGSYGFRRQLMSPDNSMWDYDQTTPMTRGAVRRAIQSQKNVDEFSQVAPDADEPVFDVSAWDQEPEPSHSGDDGLHGRTVSHATFGEGKIMKVSGTGPKAVLTIQFPGTGEKRVVRKYVKVL